jgi:hypothetical protein
VSGRHQRTDSNSRTLVTGFKGKASIQSGQIGLSHGRRLRIHFLRPNDVTRPLRILAFAYACEPGPGSEPGAGWAWSRMLARLGETWVITRRDYQAASELLAETLPWPPGATRAGDPR